MDLCRELVRDGDMQSGVRGRDCDRGVRGVRRRQLVGIRRMQRVLHGGVRMGVQRGELHGDLRGRDAAGRGGTGIAAGLATTVRQDAGRGQGRRGHPRSATTETLLEATDAAHHAGSSAGGNAQGEVLLIMMNVTLFRFAGIGS